MNPLSLSSRSPNSKTLCGIQRSDSSGRRIGKTTPCEWAGDVALGIELAGKAADVPFELDVELRRALPRRLTGLEGREDAKSLERRRLQAEGLIGLQIGGTERPDAGGAVRPPPSRVRVARVYRARAGPAP